MIKSSKGVDLLLGKYWIWGPYHLNIRIWMSIFDPINVSSYMQQIWVVFLVFPMAMWNNKIVEGIGNFVAIFIALDEIFWIEDDYKVLKLLLELRESMSVEMDIKWGSCFLTQKLDLWRIPFKCGICR